MGQTLVERVWAWLHATFPERQIYIRSEGRVQFFTCGSTLQATCAGLLLIFLGWIAFASVNVIFKDRIIAAKDHRYQQMQATYENRVADLQLSYDELNNALIAAEDRFKGTADELEAKQRNVAKLLDNKHVFEAAFITTGGGNAALPESGNDVAVIASGRHGGTASDSLGSDASRPPASVGFAVPEPRPENSFGSGASDLTVMPEPVDPQPRTAHSSKASFLDVILNFADAIFPLNPPKRDGFAPVSPGLALLEQQTRRVARLDRSETELLKSLDHGISERALVVRNELAQLGVSRLTQASGGPFVPLQAVQVDGVSDATFAAAYTDAI
jgi:hypothetical protein